jgi:hypothetical protein
VSLTICRLKHKTTSFLICIDRNLEPPGFASSLSHHVAVFAGSPRERAGVRASVTCYLSASITDTPRKGGSPTTSRVKMS